MKLFGQENFSEKDLEAIYYQYLNEKGFEEVIRQPRQCFGADLLIRHKGKVFLVEVKLYLTSCELARGVGQLLYYRFLFEKSQKKPVDSIFLVSMNDLGDDERSFLQTMRIGHFNILGLVEHYFRLKDFNRIVKKMDPDAKPFKLSDWQGEVSL